jgi:glucosamine-6-phosphate deaminase
LQIKILPDKNSLSRAAAEHAANSLRALLQEKIVVRLIAATGASQFEFLEALTSAPDIDWRRVEVFHLDEYVGLPVTHPASFRKYLYERLVHKAGIQRFHPLNGESDPQAVAKEVGRELLSAPIDLTFVGIGENGHLAFNDPPADFETDEPYLVVNLDQACRQQQVNENWFATLVDVPAKAISMSVRQILRAKEIIAIVPDARKAAAVKACFEGAISPQAPASALRKHPHVTVYLDTQSASLLSPQTATHFDATLPT